MSERTKRAGINNDPRTDELIHSGYVRCIEKTKGNLS